MAEKTNNYLIQAESARIEFLKWDQTTMISRFSLDNDSSFLYIPFFGERHSINRQTGRVMRCNENAVSFNALMSIYDVLCNTKPGAFLCGTWEALCNLSPHTGFTASGNDLFSETAKKLGGKVDAVKSACVKLGGLKATKADAGFMFNAFPFFPIIFQFWDGDDEFEPRINLLYDKNALDYIHFETAWYIAGHLIEVIERTENEAP
jgi:hypothetical protein